MLTEPNIVYALNLYNQSLRSVKNDVFNVNIYFFVFLTSVPGTLINKTLLLYSLVYFMNEL